MGKLSNSWDVTKATFAIMKQDGELYLYPIFSAGLSLVFIISLILTGFLSFFTGSESGVMVSFYILLFMAYFGIALISSFFRVATSYTAACRFGGENATMKKSFSFCFSRFGVIVKWALLSGTVGLLLNTLERMGRKGGIGRIIASVVSAVLGLAWNVVTVFVIPVIVYKGVGPFDAIKQSVDALKKTWGESLIKWIGISVIKGTITWVSILLFWLPAIVMLFMGSPMFSFILFAIGLFVIVASNIFLGIADEVFDTALYVYASSGVVPTGYENHHMKDSFRVK